MAVASLLHSDSTANRSQLKIESSVALSIIVRVQNNEAHDLVTSYVLPPFIKLLSFLQFIPGYKYIIPLGVERFLERTLRTLTLNEREGDTKKKKVDEQNSNSTGAPDT